jgi:hypothetical protein
VLSAFVEPHLHVFNKRCTPYLHTPFFALPSVAHGQVRTWVYTHTFTVFFTLYCLFYTLLHHYTHALTLSKQHTYNTHPPPQTVLLLGDSMGDVTMCEGMDRQCILKVTTYTYIYLHIPTNTYIYLHIPTYTYIYLHIPTYTYIYQYLNSYTHGRLSKFLFII